MPSCFTVSAAIRSVCIACDVSKDGHSVYAAALHCFDSSQQIGLRSQIIGQGFIGRMADCFSRD